MYAHYLATCVYVQNIWLVVTLVNASYRQNCLSVSELYPLLIVTMVDTGVTMATSHSCTLKPSFCKLPAKGMEPVMENGLATLSKNLGIGIIQILECWRVQVSSNSLITNLIVRPVKLLGIN